MSTIRQARFSARDFEQLVDDVEEFARVRFGDRYTDFSASLQGTMLIELLAFGLSQLHFYMDVSVAESYISLCRRPRSMSRLTRQIGYRMNPATAGSVDLDVAPSSVQAVAFTVEEGFRFVSRSGVVFEATSPVSWSVGETATKTVTLREGSTISINATGTGTPDQEVSLAAAGGEGIYLASGSVTVTVDGVPWEEVEFLEIQGEEQFEVHYHEEPPLIRFGNGFRGSMVPAGADIRITFRTTRGFAGNLDRNQIQSTVVPLVSSFVTIPLTINNPGKVTGGLDWESLESARANAPKFFGARKRAITKSDYEVLSAGYSDPEYGSVASATALVVREGEADLQVKSAVIALRSGVTSYTADIVGYTSSLNGGLAAIELNRDQAVSQVEEVIEQNQAITGVGESLVALSGVLAREPLSLSDAVDVLTRILNGGSPWTYTVQTAATAASGAGLAALSTEMTTEWIPALQRILGVVNASRDSISDGSAALRASAGQILAASEAISDAADLAMVHLNAIDSANESAKSISLLIAGTIEPHKAAVTASVANLIEHLDRVFGSDCGPNLVTVPILSLDGDGFYAPPSTGLLRSLQEYLTEIKDVAHIVSVVSGELFMVPVSITVRVRPSPNYSFQEARRDITGVLEKVMRRRPFNTSLILSDLYDPIGELPSVKGGKFDVILSTDTGDELDSSGNVICPDNKVLVPGEFLVSRRPEGV